MELRTNCKNCGASLNYDKTDYGKSVKCKYCRQEYHVDLLGRIEEYKVKLEIMGKVIDFYISSIEVKPDIIEITTCSDFNKKYIRGNTEITLELTGNV